MTTQEMIAALEQMLAQLKGVNPPAEPAEMTAGMVKVVPTGVMAQGNVRYWPEAMPVMASTGKPELFWSYLLRMCEVRRADGELFVPPIYKQQIGQWFLGGGPPPSQLALYPQYADRWVYPEDWYTQAEIDKRAASDAQWAADFRQKYGV